MKYPAPEYKLGKDYDAVAIWTLSKTCNFKCDYCFYSPKQMGITKKLAWKVIEKFPKINPFQTKFIKPEQARKFFDNTRKRWKIYLTGGETMIYPRFIELVKELAKKHLIVIYTNLSLPVNRLIKEINPKNIDFIYASLHLAEREKLGLSVREFIKKVKKLEKAGFTVMSDFVLYPPLIKKYSKVLKQFKKQNLFIEAKVFRGVYQGKKYPKSFTKKQRKEFLKYIPHPVDKAYSFKMLSYRGVPCGAGKNFFRVTPNGKLTRCPDYEFGSLGNLFTGQFKPLEKIKPCGIKYCNCNVAAKEQVVDFQKRK
ncbi:MAG: radical SAM/SPASM domain-containing protein [Patescibacteria group bacterium]|nr:radical SAM protein [Patescibacteria group bacterium]